MGTCKFVADVHLAKLAKYLRLLGYDTLYFPYIADEDLIELATKEDRWILSKDRGLCKRSQRCYLMHSKGLKEQLSEVVSHFNLRNFAPFSRCLVDNEPLEGVKKEQIYHLLPPKVQQGCKEFWRCPQCGRIYWHGSHYERMKRFLDEVVDVYKLDVTLQPPIH